MSDRIEVFELIERLDAASRDETLSDGMLCRAAAERLAEYISRDVKYWQSIMKRTDKQAERISELEAIVLKGECPNCGELLSSSCYGISSNCLDCGYRYIKEQEDE